MATLTLNKGHILTVELMDYLIIAINQYIDNEALAVSKIPFTFASRNKFKASDVEAIKSKMKEIFSDIEWKYIVKKGTILRNVHIQELLDNYQNYFCASEDICTTQNNEGTTVISMDAERSSDGNTNVIISWDTSIDTGRLYQYDSGPRTIVSPSYTTTIENLEPGKTLYAEGKGVETLVLDLLFVIDNSTSMTNDIDIVKNSITKISNHFSSANFDARFGWFKFANGGYYNTINFTDDAEYLQDNIDTSLSGGLEPSIDALRAASNWDFREEAEKIVLICTDENSNWNYYEPQEVADIYNENGIKVIYSFGYPELFPGWENEPTWEDRNGEGGIRFLHMFNDLLWVGLLRYNNWRSIVDWIRNLLTQSTYSCQITVPYFSCLDAFPSPNTGNCGKATTLCLEVRDLNDNPSNEDICDQSIEE